MKYRIAREGRHEREEKWRRLFQLVDDLRIEASKSRGVGHSSE